jgi:uncharacterized membrane protein
MSLKFTSSYPGSTIHVCILVYDKKCSGKFVKQGWWSLTDGQTTEPYAGELAKQNRYFYFYAEADDGHTWSGDIYAEVADQMNQCLNDNTNCNRVVGFEILDIGGSENKTVDLSASGWSFVQAPSRGSSSGGGWDSSIDDPEEDDDGWEIDSDDGDGDGG